MACNHVDSGNSLYYRIYTRSGSRLLHIQDLSVQGRGNYCVRPMDYSRYRFSKADVVYVTSSFILIRS